MHHLYILKSTHRRFSYVGVTSNLEKRIAEHNQGKSKSTKGWRPFELIYSEKYNSLSEARKREWFLKCTPQGGKLKRKFLTRAAVAAPITSEPSHHF